MYWLCSCCRILSQFFGDRVQKGIFSHEIDKKIINNVCSISRQHKIDFGIDGPRNERSQNNSYLGGTDLLTQLTVLTSYYFILKVFVSNFLLQISWNTLISQLSRVPDKYGSPTSKFIEWILL